MKKLSLTIILCLAFGYAFPQKKALNDAKKEMNNSNIEDARKLIKDALTNEETAENPETWYVAGMIENKQFEEERNKEFVGQEPDRTRMYSGLVEILPYFIKADELDLLPDKKGKVKPKYAKEIKQVISDNRLYYINGGAYFYEQKDYEKANRLFNQYLEIPKLAMFKEDNLIETDSLYPQIKYYEAITLSQLGNKQKTIAAYESLKDDGYNENEIYQYLAYEYGLAKDTVNLVRILEEGSSKFPSEPYYILSLINVNINNQNYDGAISNLEKAIAAKPEDAQLYDVMGRAYENKKDYDMALKYYEKATEIDPNFVESIGNIGRMYFNKAVEEQAIANEISDNKKYEIEIAKAKEVFRTALPYMEKAHQLKPDERDYMIALRGIYYNLNMGDKFDEIEVKLGNK